MIGIVVVSHSRALARAAVDLAMQMVDEEQRPQVRVAAGLDEETLGTDASAVAEAIGGVDSPEGVLVLLDLGSAVMSADMARELVGPEVADRVRLSSAPLVEGLVAAVVTAAGGADLDRVHHEAGQALFAKADQVGDAGQAPEAEAGPGGDARSRQGGDSHADHGLGPEAQSREVRVDLPHGLHARPAARFVACVHGYPEAEVVARNRDRESAWVSAGSLSAVATMNVRQGERVQLRAKGNHAGDVLDALEELARGGFGEGDLQQGPQEREAEAGATPLAMGSGLDVALGRARRGDAPPELSDYLASGDAATERDRLHVAVSRAGTELRELEERARAGVGSDQGDVFAAHEVWLRDPEIADPADAGIANGQSAAQAWAQAGEAAAERFAAVDDAYLRERAEDVRSVTRRVLRLLIEAELSGDSDSGHEAPDSADGEADILLLSELDAATAVTVDPHEVSGIVTAGGGSTGHGVLLAQARGIPTLTGRPETAEISSGTWLAFDVRSATVWIDPDAQVREHIEQLRSQRASEQQEERATAHEPGRTRDGTLVPVHANVTSAQEAGRAVELGAQGSGLVRTEVLFQSWSTAPTVHQQATAMAAVATGLKGRPMTVRTWDIGADKPLSYWAQKPEQNPFLGVRGIRSFTTESDMLLDQLRAVCRVARDHPVRVMFPMVSTTDEVDWALELLEAAAQHEGGSRPDGLQVGIMVEVPAAALRIAALSADLDFVSIGTNDLTQYTMAAERGHAGVEHLFDPVHPAVLRLVQMVCAEARQGVDVGVCGGAASDPLAACLLVGLGVDELSATAVAVPRVKAALRRCTVAELQDLAASALTRTSAGQVRALLDELDATSVSGRRECGTGC